MLSLYINLGKLHYDAKAYDKAGAAVRADAAARPEPVDATVMLAETRNAQGRNAEAVALIQKAIAARIAAGQKPEENWYKRAVALCLRRQAADRPGARAAVGRGLSEPEKLARCDPYLPDASTAWTMTR